MNTPVSCCWFSNETKDCLPLPGGIQGQAGCGSGQQDPVSDIPAHGSGVEVLSSLLSLPTQPIPLFCVSMT